MQDDRGRMTETPNYSLDITGDVCPMTFVKAKLLLERMVCGESAEIWLKGREVIENVPRSIRELGHQILSLTRIDQSDPDGLHRLLVIKS
jgi:TusA-related sulfurtransferase